MAIEYDNRELFARIFADPSLTPQKMYDAMGDIEFEFFVKYVLEQAGYIVEHTGFHHGPGLDLKVYIDFAGERRFHAGVQVKHFQPDGGTKVQAGHVRDLRGGLPQSDQVTGYLVTSNVFNEPALTEASRVRRIWPIDGARFVRYITYIRGTRAFAPPDPQDELSVLGGALLPTPPEAIVLGDTVARRSPHITKVVTLANHKGGVGKTTTALNLAFGLAGQEHRQQVLLVDMDTQANLTRALSPSTGLGGTPTHIGDYFSRQRTLAELIRPIHPTRFPGVWLIPSAHDLVLADRGITAGAGAELRFLRDLHAPNVAPPHVRDDRPFDWIILDTGPSMGFFTRLALAASRFALMPVSPGYFAEAGSVLLKRTIDSMSALTGSRIDLLGGIVTQWQDNALNRGFMEQVERSLSVIGRKIPIDKNIERSYIEVAQGRGRNLFSHATSPAAVAYLAVIDEIIQRINGFGA